MSIWGIAFDLDFTKEEICEFCKDNDMPFPNRLDIVQFDTIYMVGYKQLPVKDARDKANVKVLSKWNPSWYCERTKNV